ncbi:hypothetical protein KSC_099870 [Ktedonobacter sp. SOSP1-52]|nr:hypothetical protein KSC_099870 [Ktedonobacter sp. SOSP1-52]
MAYKLASKDVLPDPISIRYDKVVLGDVRRDQFRREAALNKIILRKKANEHEK